jgi:hypothetical protein
MTEDSPYDYSNTNEYDKSFLPLGYKGIVYNLSYSWLNVIPQPHNKIKILEIGVYHGANVCSLIKTLATHSESEIHCIDPWIDYSDYNEYKNTQPRNYSLFINNISKLEPIDLNKIYPYRGFSEDIVPRFIDESFDIIFIDGNHETKNTLEDGILSFKKLKKGGWLIFDDLQSVNVRNAVDMFISAYKSHIEKIQLEKTQLFINKKM